MKRIWFISAILFMAVLPLGCALTKQTSDLVIYPLYNNQAANSYVAASNGEAGVIDPSDSKRISSLLKENQLRLKYIILTHGHFDHITGIDSLVKEYPEAMVLIHPLDKDKLADPAQNVSAMFGAVVSTSVKNFPIKEKNIIKIGNSELKVIETPGHTEGSIMLLAGDIIFSGDTLFKGSVGRTDFPGGSRQELISSLAKIAVLPDKLIVYPGHGEPTNLGEEKRSNPYLNPAVRD